MYTITAECIKHNSIMSCWVGDITVLAKVSSRGNAYVCANALKEIYKSEYFKIKIV